ncbi:MAG: 1,4-dihydroxy-2-naphthoyl-CoA hydrolase [Acidobacteria bacterium]|nr:1,4-dihydroxy-2-naphthoyl-CoA hydrolase [Acidobacteriota bacterium]
MKKVSGDESLTEQELEIIRQRHAESSFGQLLGFEPVEAAPGRVVLRLPFSARLLQSLGRVHGGALFSLADHASGWAAYSMLGQGERCATLEMKINYIAAVHDEDCLAVAQVVHRGRTSIVVESDIKTNDGRLVAKTLATFIVLKES